MSDFPFPPCCGIKAMTVKRLKNGIAMSSVATMAVLPASPAIAAASGMPINEVFARKVFITDTLRLARSLMIRRALKLPVGSIMMSITNFVKLLATIKNFKDDSFTIKMHNPDSELHIKEVEA